jgi:superfamily I DNA/RNA helicase
MTPTPEQAAIVNADITSGLTIINAYAGTGKTSTLKLLSGANQNLRTLYLCYNRTVATEARHAFPQHVKPSTIHGLAFRRMRPLYGDKIGELRPRQIMELMDVRAPYVAQYVRETISNFLHSTSEGITQYHMPRAARRFGGGDMVLSIAQKLWKKMRDPQDKTAPIPHDGYLKVFASEGLADFSEFDAVFLDESQDTDPNTELVVMQALESGTPVVMVGDVHQSIYGWRGAVNSMQNASKLPHQRFDLTGSFRLKSEIAAAASKLLSCWKQDDITIRGLRADDAPERGTHAFIARCNPSLLEEAFAYVEAGLKPHFVETTAQDNWNPAPRFAELLDVLKYSQGRKGEAVTPYIKQFSGYTEIEAHAGGESTQTGASGKDRDLAFCVKLVEKHKSDLEDMIASVCNAAVGPKDADVTLSSAHRSKGLEWGTVKLAEDFIDLTEQQEVLDQKPHDDVAEFLEAQSEEINLLYVAATRGLDSVTLPISMTNWLESNQLSESESADQRPVVSSRGARV